MAEIGHGLGTGVKGAVADDLADAAVEVEHRREAEIDPDGAQFGRHQPAAGLRQAAGALGVLVVDAPEFADRRQRGKAVAKALHPPAFVVHRHQQLRLALGVDVAHQRLDLFGRLVVARKQDDAADQRMLEPLALLRDQFQPLHIEHDRAERHGLRGSQNICRHPGESRGPA